MSRLVRGVDLGYPCGPSPRDVLTLLHWESAPCPSLWLQCWCSSLASGMKYKVYHNCDSTIFGPWAQAICTSKVGYFNIFSFLKKCRKLTQEKTVFSLHLCDSGLWELLNYSPQGPSIISSAYSLKLVIKRLHFTEEVTVFKQVHC